MCVDIFDWYPIMNRSQVTYLGCMIGSFLFIFMFYRPPGPSLNALERTQLQDDLLTSREAVFAERRRRVAEICRTTTENLIPARDIYTYRKLIFIADHKFMWCPVLKAGSSTWVEHIKSLFRDPTLTRKYLRKLARKSAIGSTKDLLKEYFTFMVVRHPLDRLLSAYRDKILNPETAKFVNIQKQIIEEFRQGNSTNSTKPTFNEFLQKVLYDMRMNRKLQAENKDYLINQHWEPYWSSCSPCQIEYDVIAKTETMDIDQAYIIRSLGLQDMIRNSHIHISVTDGYNSSREAVLGYYSQVPVSLLEQVVKEYQADFDLFGYSPEKYYALAKPNR